MRPTLLALAVLTATALPVALPVATSASTSASAAHAFRPAHRATVAVIEAAAPVATPPRGGGKQFHKAPSMGKPPVTGDCLVDTSPQGCMWGVRLTTFDVSSHVVHLGGRLTATSTSQWKEQTPETDGDGLKLIKASVQPGVGFTATWKAKKVTGRHWVYNEIGNLISVPGSNEYLRSDYYAVVDKNAAVLEGKVTDLDKAPVGGVDVLIEGQGQNGGDDYYATTGQDGTYDAELPTGPWKVCMRAVKDDGTTYPGWDCDASHFTPAKKQTHLRKGKTAKENFVLDKASKVTATAGSNTLAADGTQLTPVVFKVVDHWGQGISGQQLTVKPNVKGVLLDELNPAALVCDGAGRRLWPRTYPTATDVGDDITETTDATGAVGVVVAAGYQPGGWSISATRQGDNLPAGSFGEADLTFSPVSGGGTFQNLHDNANGATGAIPYTGSQTDINALWDWTTLLAQAPWFKGYEAIPVQSENYVQAVMLWPLSNRPTIDPVTGKITGDYSAARVIEATQDVTIRGLMGGNPGTLPINWTGTSWQAGSAGVTARGFAFMDHGRSAALTRYGNFPIQTAAVGAACGNS